MSNFRLFPMAMLLLFITACVGCDPQETSKGTSAQSNQPMELGRLTKAVVRFKQNGAFLFDAEVTLVPVDHQPDDKLTFRGSEHGWLNTYEDMGNRVAEHGGLIAGKYKLLVKKIETEDGKKYNIVDEKYASTETTPLVIDVEKVEKGHQGLKVQEWDFDLGARVKTPIQ